MAKLCDFTSVGLIIRDTTGRFVLLRRAKVPYGIAPPAGHIDDHGGVLQATMDEAQEELGIIVPEADLQRTAIQDRKVDVQCSRPNSTHHVWTVFEATVPEGTTLTPDVIETKGAGWYSLEQMQELAERTKQYQAGNIAEDEWESNPGLEPTWLQFLIELKIIS